MTEIFVNVTNATAKAESTDILTAGMVGVPAHFTFDEAWDGLAKTAVFQCGDVVKDRILDTTGTTTVPHEVLATAGGKLYIGVEGTDAEGNLVLPSTMALAGRIMVGADPFGDESVDPSLPVWEQIIATGAISSTRVNANGELEITLLSGEIVNVGNVIGPKGERGDKGDTGAQGPRGESGMSAIKCDYASSTLPIGRAKGDVNGDGVIDDADPTAISEHRLGTMIITDEVSLWAADVDGNGTINAADASRLTAILSGSVNYSTYATDYYGNWQYDSENGYYYYDVAVPGMTVDYGATVIPNAALGAGFVGAIPMDGAMRFCFKGCPTEEILCRVLYSPTLSGVTVEDPVEHSFLDDMVTRDEVKAMIEEALAESGGGSSNDNVVGTWVFVDDPDLTTMPSSTTVIFVCNGTTYTKIECGSYGPTNWGISAMRYDVGSVVTVYINNPSGDNGVTHGWSNEAYKTIKIAETPDSQEFITWLQANATKVN